MQKNLTELAALFTQAFPRLATEGRQQALCLYRLLAKGKPVTVAEFASQIGLTEEMTQNLLQGWTGVYYQADGAIVGFWGLSVSETAHKIIVDQVTLYTWCAWDTLFIPIILQAPAEVITICPVSRQTINLHVAADRIESVAPASSVISFIKPELQKIKDNVVQSFCQQIFFLASEAQGRQWCADRPDAFILTMDEGFALGKEIVDSVFFI